MQGVAEFIGAADRMIDIATAIDKVEKINVSGVYNELKEKEFTEEHRELTDFLLLKKPAQNSKAIDSYELAMEDFKWLRDRVTPDSVEFSQPEKIEKAQINLNIFLISYVRLM